MEENTSALAVKRNDEDIMTAIQNNGFIINSVEKTPERCLAVVKQNGEALAMIPKALHTQDLCLEAVKQNGQALKYVSKKMLSHDICLEAVKDNGEALSFVPEKQHTKELFLEAIKQNGIALRYIPEKNRSKTLCMKAVKQNGMSLEFVPKSVLSPEFFLLAVEQDGLALEFVPGNRKSKKLCVMAVNNKPLALEYVPDRFKSRELCNEALRQDLRAFIYLPESLYTLDSCLKLLEMFVGRFENTSEMSYDTRHYIKAIVSRFSDAVRNDVQIIRLERKLRVRYFKEKFYDSATNTFVTKEYICYQEEDMVSEFETFIDFYKHLEGDLEDANLLDYSFKGISLKDFNIEGAYISSAVLIEQNLYDDSFYSKNITDNGHYCKLMFSAENEVVEAIAVLHESDLSLTSSLNDHSRKIYYVSDIHLNHKLLKAFPDHATKQEVAQYIRLLVGIMVATATDRSCDDYLLIVGDISFNFEISELFYTELKNHWTPQQIVVVLGNHELWDCSRAGVPSNNTDTVENIIDRYRKMFSDLGISFLQNELLISNGLHTTILSEEQLTSVDLDQLKNICLKSSLVILGGIGYSGLNPDFNATHGIYRDTIQSLDEDMAQAQRFERVYSKINNALCGEQIIILSHTPKDDWSNDDYNRNWIYVNGHTHRNEYYCSDEKTVYADNQIGYYSGSVGLKYFKTSKTYDIFKYYADGTYIISREQYLSFNRGVGINVTFNRIGKVHMLKNSGVYCFIFENTETGKFYLLNGGTINNLEHNGIDYYYEKMAYYSDAIKGLFSEYHNALKLIADAVKKLGGMGEIHGCIVDIDFFNHIFVNPTDGTITPYVATSVVHKFLYPDVSSLLLEQRKDLYDNLIKLTGNTGEGIRLLQGEAKVEHIDISRYVPDTYMYSPSRIMRSIQYLTDVNVIRIWNDKVMNLHTRIENKDESGKLTNNGNLLLPQEAFPTCQK